MKRSLLVLFLGWFSFTATAQSVFISDSGHVSFYSSAPLEDIKAACTQVNSIINTVTGEVAFMIPLRGFKFAKALMQEHFNEKYLESDKYPHATFKGRIVDPVNFDDNGTHAISARGKLGIHGIEKDVLETGTLEIRNRMLVLNTRFYVALADFNIAIPKILFNNIADTVEVNLNAIYHPYQKK
jgi:hypothetical protein